MVPFVWPRDFSLRFWFYSLKNKVALILSYTDCYPTNQGPLPEVFRMVQGLRSGLNPIPFPVTMKWLYFKLSRNIFLVLSCYIGCFFHIVKNFKRAIETHGLRAQYNGGADFSLQARMIPAALAFVPAQDLVRAFEDLSDTRMTLTSLNLIYIIITIN